MFSLEDYIHPWKDLYRKSPAWFKRSAGLGYGFLPARFRYGKSLAVARAYLEKSQWFSREQLDQKQWEQAHALLEFAYETVPYYRKTWKAIGLHPSDINSFADWEQLPVIDKDTVRLNKDDLVSSKHRKNCLATNTGGSTGEPLHFFWERGRTRTLERAFMWRQWEWTGFTYGSGHVNLRGQTVKEDLWHFDPIDKTLFINAYNISEKRFHEVDAKIRRFKPKAIAAYPSNMTSYALIMDRLGVPHYPSVNVLLLGSENLYPDQKELFKRVFKARPYSWYGHGESCCLAGYCEKEDYYHVYTEYGYTELLGADNNSLIWNPGATGEICATSFINNAMPLIRYKTGDIATAGPDACTCGRNYPLIERIEGRKQEYIVTIDDRIISLTGLVFGQHWGAFANIARLQIEQKFKGQVVFRIIKGPDYSTKDEQEILDKVSVCTRGGLEVSFEYVDLIPPSPRGKHLFLKQHLKLESSWAGSEAESAL